MQTRSTLLLTCVLGSMFSADALAQTQDLDMYWADKWNLAFHRFTDRDADGKYNSPHEVAFLVDWNTSINLFVDRLDITLENGSPVGYFLDRFTDSIYRGIDLDGNGQLAGPGEFYVYRDSGALDGASEPTDLSVTDDGALWWTAATVIMNPHNGVSRIVDLNGDGDGADPGEQILMIDGNAGHIVEHDTGSGPIAAWALQTVSAAGNGVIAFADGDDQAVYRFEDLNGDGDLLDADESILLLNATGARADFPMQPDFANGTLRSLSLPPQPPFTPYARFTHLASAMENGQRAFYFATDALENSSFFTPNIHGEGMNFLIFRGVDLNGDRDVNDAGEVTFFHDGSNTSGTPNLMTLRGLDAVDGGRVFAIQDMPLPNYNAYVHELQDQNGDGDAEDAGEFSAGVFDLSLHGPTEFFPGLLNGELFADPVDLAFSPRLYFEPDFFPYCFGNSCPCGNDDPDAGCVNSTGSGALLVASGTASVAADDLVLTASDLPANKFGIVYMGGATNLAPFADGQRCVAAGSLNICRYPVQNSGATGTLTQGPGIVAFSLTQGPGCHIDPGETWNFQAWYRDPNGPCGGFFNLSSAVAVTFAP